MSDLDSFYRLAAALTPWRDQLVFVGGWAHRLYREHPLADIPGYEPLRTRDVDVAFATGAALTGNIQAELLAAGFEEVFRGEDHPPVTHYSLGDEGTGLYAEFLTPLAGSGIRKSGQPDATEARAGITAQKLKHFGMLLVEPWTVSLAASDETGAAKFEALRIPNPVSFIVQKILIRRERRPGKRAQDALYVHDTLELFSGRLRDLQALWRDAVSGALTTNEHRSLRQGVDELFATMNDTLRDAARIPVDRTLSPERLRALCVTAFEEILV